MQGNGYGDTEKGKQDFKDHHVESDKIGALAFMASSNRLVEWGNVGAVYKYVFWGTAVDELRRGWAQPLHFGK